MRARRRGSTRTHSEIDATTVLFPIAVADRVSDFWPAGTVADGLGSASRESEGVGLVSVMGLEMIPKILIPAMTQHKPKLLNQHHIDTPHSMSGSTA